MTRARRSSLLLLALAPGWWVTRSFAAGPVAPASPVVPTAPIVPAAPGTLIDAAGHGAAARVEALLAAGADPNAAGADGRTALMAAARLGRHDIVRTLLVHGAHRDQRDARGRVAFDYAIESGQSDVIALLRDAS